MPSNEQTPDFQSALERRLPSDLALDATLCPFSDAHSQHNNTRGPTAGSARTYAGVFALETGINETRARGGMCVLHALTLVRFFLISYGGMLPNICY
jgi:hypothetical protein